MDVTIVLFAVVVIDVTGSISNVRVVTLSGVAVVVASANIIQW